jgi:hypothetical protein
MTDLSETLSLSSDGQLLTPCAMITGVTNREDTLVYEKQHEADEEAAYSDAVEPGPNIR